MNFELLNSISWIFAVCNLLGAILVIKKKACGFIFYTIANIFWVILNIGYELYSQAVLLIGFTALNIWGWIDWKFKKKGN